MRFALLAVAIALGTLATNARAQTSNSPKVVAELELAAPTLSDFIVRGTIPVPPNTYPRRDGLLPFGIRDATSQIVPAQIESVSFYPDDAQGADVVEVLARVHRPSGAAPGARIRYEVVEFPHPYGRFVMPPSVSPLFAGPGSVVLATRDVFGNIYKVDLLAGAGGKRVQRAGETALQSRYYGTMLPVAPVTGPTGTLPHLMGVHSYVGTWRGENVVTLDLRVNNGASGLDKNDSIDDPQDKIYFDQLDLVVPAGWVVLQDVSDPFLGTPRASGGTTSYPLVKRNTGGTMHVIGVQGQFHRRLALTPAGNEPRARAILNEEGLGFVQPAFDSQGRELWSWWSRGTSRYFPQRHRLPELTHLTAATCRGKMRSDFLQFSGYLQSGASQNAYPIHSPVLGWAHPWGVKYGGMTSGSEIFMYDGVPTAYGASNEGYRLAEVQHRMYTDRQPVALFNKNGDPTSLKQWAIHGSGFDYVNMLFFENLLPNGPDPFGYSQSPTFQVNYAAANGLQPSYEADLLAHLPIDLQHLVRYLNAPKVLAWLGNDALAKDDLRMQAEIARLSYHDLANSATGSSIVSGMLHDIDFVQTHPGIGFAFGRGEGWCIDAMSAAYSLGSVAWRAEAKPWFDQVANLVSQGQASCSGFIQSNTGSKLLNGLFHARQSIEQAIIEHALVGVRESVYRDYDMPRQALVDQVLAKSLYSMVTYPGWSDAGHGPWSILAVAPLNITMPPYCGYFPPGGGDQGVDAWQTGCSFAYGYEITGDPLFLQRALEMIGGTDLQTAIEHKNFQYLETRAALLALSQRISYP